MKVKPSLLLFCILCTFCACREDSQMNQRFLEIDELTNTHPDSALAVLDTMRTTVKSCSRPVRMKYELLYAKAQNRAYVDFTTDSVMLEVCGYYDHHGTPNERMLAHYLLGCTYRDMGEAPRTLECYKDAINCADTLSADCDYRTMMSICGQMATLYDKQAMTMEEIEMNKLTSKYALLCGDTINYIKGIELQIRPYNLLHDTTNLYLTSAKAYDLYLSHGYPKHAAQALAMSITNKVKFGKYEDAKHLMDIYETQSELFDNHGNIKQTHSIYYKDKGMYFMGINKLDSAELFFQKLKQSGYLMDAYKGLLGICVAKRNGEAAAFYSALYAEAIENKFTSMSTETARQIEAMYDYTRNQQIAYSEKLKRERVEKAVILLSFLSIVIVTCAAYFFQKTKEKKKQMLKKMTDEYFALSAQYEKTTQELEFSKESFTEYVIQKNRELEVLNECINNYRVQFEKMNNLEKRKALCTSTIVLEFKELLSPQDHKYKTPTSKQWKALLDGVQQASAILFHNLAHSNLTEQEHRIAILTYLDFTGEEIATLMGVSSQRVSNAKRNANKKAFGKDETKSFKYNITHLQPTI